MSLAFEITEEDVLNVLTAHDVGGSWLDYCMELVQLEDDRITKAALHGTDIEQQTEYAYAEIEEILAGVLPDCWLHQFGPDKHVPWTDKFNKQLIPRKVRVLLEGGRLEDVTLQHADWPSFRPDCHSSRHLRVLRDPQMYSVWSEAIGNFLYMGEDIDRALTILFGDSDVPDALNVPEPEPARAFVSNIETLDRNITFLGADEDSVDAQMATWCRENWPEWEGCPECPETDSAVIEAYFDIKRITRGKSTSVTKSENVINGSIDPRWLARELRSRMRATNHPDAALSAVKALLDELFPEEN